MPGRRGWRWDGANSELEVHVNGTEVAKFDSNGFALSGRGTVTQLTSKSTGVTVNTRTGSITTHNASLNGGTEVGFTVTNSTVAANDVVVASIASGATADSYSLTVDAVSAGSFRLSLSNLTAGALGEALVINFAVIKSAA